jgi:hypothetical protein
MSGVALSPEDPWAGHARTVVEIVGPRGRVLVHAAPAGVTGTWPWDTADAVFVMTAWDPGDERPGPAENRRRQVALEEDLRRLTDALWGAAGVDPDTGQRDEGVAVEGLAEADALALGARYRQDAVFRWTPDAWEIVACDGGRRVGLGWTAEPG